MSPRQWKIGPLEFEGALLQTRVGRRILGLFVLCALLPVSALGAAVYFSVSRTLQDEARQRVRDVSRRIGLTLHDRLEGLAAALEAVTARLASSANPGGGGGGPSAAAPDQRFEALALVSGDGAPRPIYGVMPPLPPLTARQRDHLAAGRTMLAVESDDSEPRVLLARSVGHSPGGPTLVWALANPNLLATIFGAAGEPGATACAVLANGRRLYCDEQLAGHLRSGGLAWALGEEATGTFEWVGLDRYIAGYWSLFLDIPFASPDVRIIYTEPRAAVLAPLARFRRTAPLAALLSLLVVGLLSTVQIRRNLRPLAALRAGTERVARREFDRAVEITSRDEFEDLASAFNDMSKHLKDQFAEAERLNHALGESETRLRAIFESAADGIVTVDERGRIESFNRTAERVFGRQRQDVTGLPLADLFATPLGTGPIGLPVPTTVGSPTLQVAARRSDGSTFPAELALSTAHTPGRTLYTVFVRDITERKRAAEDRERLEGQLRHAQKLETVGTLAGGIAHDFNNILTPILGYVDLALADAPSGSQLRADLSEVFSAANRAKDLVKQILLFSRRSEQVFATVDVAPVVKEALKLLRASLPTTIEIRTIIAPDVSPIVGDLSQLHQVLMNLCTNSSYAMREKNGLLEVRLEMAAVDSDLAALHPALRAGPVVRLSVSDTGHGMDQVTLERLFEPFFTTKPAGEGTGLGMSIVHGIITSHGGAIAVKSTPGAGTRFDIFLPPAPEDEGAEPKTGRAAAPPASGHIVVVDDDDVIARLVTRVLERSGYRVTRAGSSPEAVELVVKAEPRVDLVITDQTMPMMTGTELAQEIRQRRPGVPMILMTGYAALGSPEEMRDLGFREVLLKPLEGEVLAAAVARALGASGEASPPVPDTPDARP